MSKSMARPILELRDLSFSYRSDALQVAVLRALDFKVQPGELVAIQGPSGSGKSTLFYILGFLLRPTGGTILFDGRDVSGLSEDERTVLRNRRIGFVFQQFHLLPKTSALENILLPTRYPSELAADPVDHREKALSLAAELGLGSHLAHLPNQLSGGQQQRVAIARALINDVDLILADEPTGNLDSRNAAHTLDLLTELNARGKTIIIITHDAEVARRCHKVYHLRDGAFTHVEDRTASRAAPAPEAAAPALPALPKTLSPAVFRRVARSVLPLVRDNLLRNRSKSLLTMLGVVIGIAAVLAMVTLGQFTKRKLLESYETLGANKLSIRGYPNWELKATDSLTVSFQAFEWERDFAPLPRIFPELRAMSPVLDSWNCKAMAGGLSLDEKVSPFGVTPEYLAITNRKLLAGRGLSPFHVEARSPVCVVGLEIAQRLFARSNPLGQIVTISDGRRLSFPCQIIGVLASTTSNMSWAPPNRHVLVPYTYFQTVSDNWWGAQIHEAVLQVAPGADVELAGKKLKSYFERKYGKAGQFHIDMDSTLIAQMKRFLNLFAVLLTAIALLSLAVGGIGINNMMLVSVAERIKEFGLRKALGATNRSIRLQVLLESVTLCTLAGAIGILLGFASYQLLIFAATKFVPNLQYEWVFEPLAALLSAASIIGVGVASGVVPALKAEKLEVIEALRSE